MKVRHERCCGIDVHKQTVVACVIVTDEQGEAKAETRTFGTMTGDLQALGMWLKGLNVQHIAVESTGVYWKPVYNLLEGQFEIMAPQRATLVVNPEHPRSGVFRVKALKGKKTDVADAEWIADLLRHGLLKGSFIPDALQRELRDLTRYRTTLVDEHSRFVNRVQKVLEDANIKLSGVASDVMGQSARAILAQLVEGNTDAAAMAELAKGKLRKKQALLEKALTGRVKAHHRFMLTQILSQIAEQMRPFEAELARWDQLPGINVRLAQIILAEVGASLEQFQDADHLSSWAGMCPGNNESAGKRKSGKTRKGSKWLRRALTEAAHGASRTKNKYFQSMFRRLAAKRGKKRAAIAVGHSLLVTGYHMITRQTDYVDLGANFYDERDREGAKRRAVKKLQQLGFAVQLAPLPVAAA